MILAGIDEAGYGPRLGPLVVAMNAFRAGGPKIGARPGGVWPECRFCAGDGPVKVCDSKAVYSGPDDLGALERPVLAFAALAGGAPSSFDGFLTTWAVEGTAEAFSRPWYGWRELRMPAALSPADVAECAREAAAYLAASGLEYLGARMCVVDEGRYNEIISRIDNKATLLFGRASILMRRLWEDSGGETVYLTVDRHGGRKFYAGLLDIAFPKADIRILMQTDDESAYRLSGGGREMFVRFKVRAESIDSAVALSSMWAKYVRELFMRLFNDYWVERAGGLKPTAGYWVDAERFLADLRAASVITDAEIARFTRVK